jgi:hypothetical protein
VSDATEKTRLGAFQLVSLSRLRSSEGERTYQLVVSPSEAHHAKKTLTFSESDLPTLAVELRSISLLLQAETA